MTDSSQLGAGQCYYWSLAKLRTDLVPASYILMIHDPRRPLASLFALLFVLSGTLGVSDVAPSFTPLTALSELRVYLPRT